MSELLQNWLNNEVGLSTNVNSFEKDFSNGYLFGEILHKFRQQEDFESFDNRSTYEAKLSNFKKLEPTFKALGIKFNATQSNAMMKSERGASLRLLYQLKMATERLLLTSEAAQVKGGQPQAAPPGGGVTKGIRVPREKFDGHEKRFFEHRLRATCLNVKQARLDKLTKKFEEEKHVQEKVAMNMDAIEMGRIAEQRDIHRFALRERMRLNRAAKDEWNKRSTDAWAQNMLVRQDRETREIAFEDRVLRTRYERNYNMRDFHSNEVKSGVEMFEAGLANLGLTKKSESQQIAPGDESSDDDDSDNHPERLLATMTKADTSRELVEALQGRMPNGQELEQEAGLFLRKIKESKRAGSVARKERERRRRRVLVEQQREQDLLEESKLEEVLLEKLSRESIEEKRISYTVWRTQQYEDVIVQNRKLRQKEYTARRKKDQQEALERDQDMLQEMLQTMREQQERERLRYRAVERGRRAARMASVSEECEGILELITGMAFASLQQEQLTDSSEVDETLWREWTQLFVEGIPVSSSESPSTSVATMHPLLSVPPESTAEPPGSILDDAAVMDYLEGRGQWQVRNLPEIAPAAVESEDPSSPSQPPLCLTFDIVAEVEKTLASDENRVSFLDKLDRQIEVVDGRPVNFRFGVVVGALLDRCYAVPPFPDPPSMPEVPLRLVISGKPYSGRRTLAARLAENYNLQVIDVDEVIREALLLSKRPDAGSQCPIDMLYINDYTSDELCKRHEDDGNPYVRQLQEIGYELQELLDRGEAINDEIYVHLVTTKIRSVFHDRMRKNEAPIDENAENAEQEAAIDVVDDEGMQPKESPLEAAQEVADTTIELQGEQAAEAPMAEATTFPDMAESSELLQPSVEGSASFDTCGWVVVGFPETSQRLQLFERFLSGFVAPTAKQTPEAEVKKSEAALLVPKPYEEPPPFALTPGGYDLHIRLRVDNDEIVRRAVGRRLDPMTSLMYHLEDSPPCTKNQIIYERLVPVDDLTNSMGSLTNRMHSFDIAQPEVEGVLSFFGPFADAQRLRDIDANTTQENVHDVVEEQVAMLLERKRAAYARALQEKQAAEEEAAAKENAIAESEEPKGEADENADVEKQEAPTTSETPAKEGEKNPKASAEGEEVPMELVKMTDLPAQVEKLEEKVFQLLLQEWQEMQDNFTTSIRQLFRWHRLHLSDFRQGVHGMQHRFLQFVERIDDKQALVDSFVFRFNAFSEEYPDMRKQDLTKEELHQQADDLHDLLQQKVNLRKEENMAELENITTSQWAESHVQVLAAQVQHAIRLEAQRYHAACQLLCDFYYGAIGAGLPEPREPCPSIEALGLDENGVAEKSRLRNHVEASEEKGTQAHWEFPFVEDLMTQAQAGLFRPVEWCLPSNYEKKEEVPDPKAKAKAKGRSSPPPAPGKAGKDSAPEVSEKPVDVPPLFVDLQQALLAERVHYQYRLVVLRDWAYRRLHQATEATEKLFVQLRDWLLLRRKKELDSCLDVVDVIKEYIESEELIKARLTLEGAHLHRHPNVHLQADYIPEIRPELESLVPYRWTMEQLDHLLEAVSGAARALRPSSLVLPVQSLLGLLLKYTQAPSSEPSSSVDQLLVPQNWRPCDVERLQSLCAILDQPPRTGTIDCVEFLLHMGLLHSPSGWPSLQTLLDIRQVLEAEVPQGASWPDFYVTEELLAGMPLFADTAAAEAELAEKFAWDTASKPAKLDRCREQMRWVLEVFRAFPAPLRQNQGYELEVAWYDQQVRCKDEVKIVGKHLDDGMSGHSTPRTPQINLEATDVIPDSPSGTSEGETQGPAPAQGPPPRPKTPRDLPSPPANGGVSVRQFFTYLCLGSSLEDGLSRSIAVLGPSGANLNTTMPVADLHAILLQLGARSTPPSFDGDGRPRHPSLAMFCEEMGLEKPQDTWADATTIAKDMLGSSQAQKMVARYGFAKRHCRAEVEKLFPKNLQAGAKILPNQRALAS